MVCVYRSWRRDSQNNPSFKGIEQAANAALTIYRPLFSKLEIVSTISSGWS